MSNLSKNIVKVVDTFPSVKENYNLLLKAYWILFDDARDLDGLDQATPAESITREFRRLVENGVITLPERVQEARKERERAYRHEFATLG